MNCFPLYSRCIRVCPSSMISAGPTCYYPACAYRVSLAHFLRCVTCKEYLLGFSVMQQERGSSKTQTHQLSSQTRELVSRIRQTVMSQTIIISVQVNFPTWGVQFYTPASIYRVTLKSWFRTGTFLSNRFSECQSSSLIKSHGHRNEIRSPQYGLVVYTWQL